MMKKRTVNGTGNAAVDAAISALGRVIATEDAAGRSPFRTFTMCGTRSEGAGVYAMQGGCGCPGCHREIVQAAAAVAYGPDFGKQGADPVRAVH